MSGRVQKWLALGLVAVIAAGAGVAPTEQPAEQPTGKEKEPGPSKLSLDASMRAKLAALKPENPEAYFLLAEEVADGAEDEARSELARTLFVLAMELDRKGGSVSALGAASALAIARLERLDRDKRWLAAIAGSLDRRYAMPDWNVGASTSISDDTAYKAATVLGLARSGDGRESRRLFDQPGVGDVLRRYERAMGNTGFTGALSRLEKYTQQWPCSECGNARMVMRPGDKGPEPRLCPSCRGNPGPRLAEEEYIAQLRFEAALLSGIQRSWAAQVVVDQGALLRDPDLEEVAPTFGVDPAKPYWREGAWVATP